MMIIILGTVALIIGLLVKNRKMDWFFFTSTIKYAEENDLIPLRRLLWRLYIAISFVIFGLGISSFIESIPNNITFMIGRITIIILGIVFAIRTGIITKELKKKSR